MTTAVSVPTTASSIAKKDLHTPLNEAKTLPRVRSMLDNIHVSQQAAADLTEKHVARHDGPLRRIEIAIGAAPAAAESMSLDVQINGVSVFASLPILDNTGPSPAGVYDVTALANKVAIKIGDVVSVILDYTAGGGPTPIAVVDVWVEWG